jgi:hypothetical protein
MKSQQMQQLFIQFINYVWHVLHVSELHSHLQGALRVAWVGWRGAGQWLVYCGWGGWGVAISEPPPLPDKGLWKQLVISIRQTASFSVSTVKICQSTTYISATVTTFISCR